MGKQTVLAKKKRGPPATGIGVQVVVRLQPVPLSALDAWAAKQKDQPTRAEALRRLMELGLTVRPKAKQPSPVHALRAKALARSAIDKMSDATAPPDEQAQRRQRLTKGPLEFREGRIDQPKAKPK
jgi:hypothetical protein